MLRIDPRLTAANSATGGATSTVPSAGFADATQASLIQQRVSTPTNTLGPSPSVNSSGLAQNNKSHHSNTGAITGGVVGGVVGLAVILGVAWFLFRRRLGRASKAEGLVQGGRGPSRVQELDARQLHEAPTHGTISEMSGEGAVELPGTIAVAELGSNKSLAQY